MRREPEVPEERVPVVECLDGPVRITSKELAIIHSVKSGTLQNACSARPRVVADLGKSARMHIVRLMNYLVKGSKRMMTKYDWHENVWQLVVETRTYWTSIIERTTIGLCLLRHEAAEVHLTEELRHAETNPTCEIHEGYCASH